MKSGPYKFRFASYIPQIPAWVELFLLHEAWVFFSALLPYSHPRQSILSMSEAYSSRATLWFQYDALFYLHIAHYGYGSHPSAFYPLLPILIWLAHSRWIALLIMQAIFAADVYYLNRFLTTFDLSAGQITLALALFAFNPAAVFYSTLYTEPLMLLLSLLSTLQAQEHKYITAAVTAGLAALSHPTGALLGIMPLVLLIQSFKYHNRQQLWGAVIWGSGIVIALALFVGYSLIFWHTPFGPWLGESGWHSRWVWPWVQYQQVIVIHSADHVYEIILSALSLPYLLGAILLASKWSKSSLPALIYAWAGTLVSLSFYALNTPFHSTLRLLSPYFPLYAGISLANNKVLIRIVIILWGAASLYGAIRFTHQWWWQ
ncbi:hypothetical protein BXT84_13235 [Sulfobacillus thermotolerans]|uniref:Glycosyltransferase RgtA/B/C/D-like domain-containing protein n=1 Tax=Sulfobacillus thermotolerans TaxID=338644 RepID=A0ABM6RTX8_9FIRM|nr:hypothetical protein BXT84_13235 [Sulfobacillus thermotolerans]